MLEGLIDFPISDDVNACGLPAIMLPAYHALP
jgi:hypothetical protein